MPRVTLASGLTLSYADQGDPSGPAVLMLPGPTDSWRSYQPVLDLWKATFAGLLAYDDQTELPLIETPTLLVWGDADAIVPRAMQDQLACSIPHADLLVYPGVGHTPRWDDPV